MNMNSRAPTAYTVRMCVYILKTFYEKIRHFVLTPVMQDYRDYGVRLRTSTYVSWTTETIIFKTIVDPGNSTLFFSESS